MEAGRGVLDLLDLYWFQTLILRRISQPPTKPSTPVISSDSGYVKSLSSDPSPSPPPPTLLLRRHRRSHSDEIAHFPAIQIQNPKLRPILSGEVQAEDPHQMVSPAGETRDRRFKRNLNWLPPRRQRKSGESKSLTDLEFEELKGFMDLGFTFSDDEAVDPWLISIVPGLQRLREAALDAGDSVEASSSSAPDVVEAGAVAMAPYLSEAWEAAELEEERCNALLRNWRIPIASEGVDMKDHLRLWAHAVAFAVR